MENIVERMRELVFANRILAREGVVDAFGHISMRHPDNPERYFLSRSRAPELITADDIMEFTLDGEAIDGRDRRPYGERPIHGGLYEKRPDVNSVVHNHALELIPFGVTNTRLQPIAHVGSPIGYDVPTWDIRDKFGETDHLVVPMEQGRDLASCLGDGRVALMRGHGGVVAARDVREAVMTAVYLQINARLQLMSMPLGDPKFLTPTEVELCCQRQFSPLGIDRAWEYWCDRAGCGDL